MVGETTCFGAGVSHCSPCSPRVSPAAGELSPEAGFLFAQFSVTFYHKSVLNFVKSFSVSIKMIIWNFIPQFVNIVYHIDLFAYSDEFLHPWNKSTTSWCMITLMLLDLICLYFAEDFSICVHQWYWSVVFSLCVISLPNFGISVMMTLLNELGSVPLFTVFWKILKRIGVSSFLKVW